MVSTAGNMKFGGPAIPCSIAVQEGVPGPARPNGAGSPQEVYSRALQGHLGGLPKVKTDARLLSFSCDVI